MAEENTSLEDILTPTEPEVPKPEGTPKEGSRQQWRDKEMESRGQVRDPVTGQYAAKQQEPPKEEPKAEPKAEEKPKEAVKETPKETPRVNEDFSPRERAAFAKAADETRKRQELQRQLEELKKKETEKPFFEDPEGALDRQRQDLENKINFSILSTKVQTSESIARSRYPDYDEKFYIFNQMVQETPHLAEQAFSSTDPAEFAYKTAKRQKELNDAGGIEQHRAKVAAELKAQIRAELEAEFKKREEETKKQRAELPGSLTDVPSKGVNRPVWGGPTPLEDILKG